MTGQTHRTELLAPAGDFETALAAFDAGADAIYCGLKDFSARAFARNFSPEDLRNIVRVARRLSRKVYVTFNTLVEDAEIPSALERLALIDSLGADAVIVQDLGIARLARANFPNLALHASTQLFAHNLEGVLALKDAGFSRVVLARELTLDEVASIARRSGVEIECFIHGALCYSISGLCLFSAIEKSRSGNRGRCAYCCRLPFGQEHPFSMKDLRLGRDAKLLADVPVASLKIEGRMKSAIYVASVVKYYREILDGTAQTVTEADLETVFSRRTTPLYLHGRRDDVVEPVDLGHLGTPIGIVKRVTRDREGRRWIRFHTSRALERHDGLQFLSPSGGKPVGFAVSDMRKALSRNIVFIAAAGDDVEVFLPEDIDDSVISGGEKVYQAMSNEVKRRFPLPSFRPGEYPGIKPLDVRLRLSPDGLRAECGAAQVTVPAHLEAAKDPATVAEAARKAFSRLGGTDFFLSSLSLENSQNLFAPVSLLNALRRDLVSALEAREKPALCVPPAVFPPATHSPEKTIKLRAGQPLPDGDWDEIVIEIDPDSRALPPFPAQDRSRLRFALPVFTPEAAFNRLRVAVKNLLREGFTKFEAADLATLRLLSSLGIADITADWSLYAANRHAAALLAAMGAKRFVTSPEANAENLRSLQECGVPLIYLEEQYTPLFLSLHKPGAELPPSSLLVAFKKGPLWITTHPAARKFTPAAPSESARRDISFAPPMPENFDHDHE